MPKVSVIISTYNGDRHLVESVGSITNQTFSDFELIIVDDGSTDRTRDLLNTFHDPRIRVLTNQQNFGIALSQNRAVSTATGEYLALMDHDDISLPHRLETQVDFLDSYPTTGMLSTNSVNIDKDNHVTSEARYPTDEIEFAWNTLILGCPNVHTTLMIRKSEFDRTGGYGDQFRFACDYDLISRLILTTKAAHLDEPLVKWRAHASSVSRDKNDALMAEAARITKHNAALLLNHAVDDSVWWALRLLIASSPSTIVDLTVREVDDALSLLLKLQGNFYRIKKFDREYIRLHQRRLHQVWGKHFLALSIRGNGNRNLKCRSSLLMWSTKLLAGLEKSELNSEKRSVPLEATQSEPFSRS